jgi:hypothetical protein
VRLLVALALVAAVQTVHADDAPIGLVVEGDDPLRAQVESHLAGSLRSSGFQLVAPPLSAGALSTLANCMLIEDLACARGVVEARARAPRVLHAQVSPLVGGDGLTLALTWFSAGHAPVADSHTCESCATTWRTAATELVTRLAARAPAPSAIDTGPDPAPERRGRSRLWPRTLVVAGVLTAVAGGVTLYYGVRDGASHKYVYPQLTPVGIALLAVGGGVAVGGVFWGRDF